MGMCSRLETLSLTIIPDTMASTKSECKVDLQWLTPLTKLRSITLECPPSTVCTFVNMAQLTQLHSVTIIRGQPQQLEELVQLPNLTEVHLPRFQGSTMPESLAACRALTTLSIELHNIPIRNEVCVCESVLLLRRWRMYIIQSSPSSSITTQLDVGCLASLHALTSLTITTSRPARLYVPSLHAVRTALPKITHIHIDFCNCQIVQKGVIVQTGAVGAPIAASSCVDKNTNLTTVGPTIAIAPRVLPYTPRLLDNNSKEYRRPPCTGRQYNVHL